MFLNDIKQPIQQQPIQPRQEDYLEQPQPVDETGFLPPGPKRDFYRGLISREEMDRRLASTGISPALILAAAAAFFFAG